MAKLYFRYATMNSGKSIDLIRTAYSYLEKGLRPLVLKPQVSNRAEELGEIFSRTGLSFPCIPIDGSSSLSTITKDPTTFDIILVDEAQFLTVPQVEELFKLTTKGKPVLCYGLRADFRQQLFEGSKRLFELADKIEEIKSVCKCGKAAKHNIRIDQNGNRITQGEVVAVGTEDKYKTVCSECLEKISK